jgi:hypothetical protein
MAEVVQTTQLRDALAWATNETEPKHEASSNPFIWFWEAVEGDFNENRTTGQIMVDAGISMIPLIDQVCDIRDLIADCKKIGKAPADSWAWVSLLLTLIGLFPSLGSLAKGVLKIFFAFMRREGGLAVENALNAAMTWVITFLRRRDVQVFLKSKQVDEVFQWLADELKSLRGKIDTATVMAAFDRAIKVLDTLSSRVKAIPVISAKAQAALEQVKSVRKMADKHIGAALQPTQQRVNAVIAKLELQILTKQHGIVDTANIHYRGVIPEAHSIALMRKRKPGYLSATGDQFNRPVRAAKARQLVDQMSSPRDLSGKPRPSADQFPNLSNQSIASFHTLRANAIRGPARLYRVVSPSSRGMSDCWISEEIFRKLQSSPDPKEAWRRHLGVWPDWNANGQFVTYDVKAGETLNTWAGLASSQTKQGLPNHHLEGGWEQIVFTIPKGDARADTIVYFKKNGRKDSLGKSITQAEVDVLTAGMNNQQKTSFFENHLAIREKINHPSISGPFETGWGYTDFDGAGFSGKIGLPALPGQLTNGAAR